MIATFEAAADEARYSFTCEEIDSHEARFVAFGIASGVGAFRHHVNAKGRRKAPTLPLPGPDSGMGPLAIRVAEEAFGVALNDPPFPVAQWGGPVPKLKSAHLFFAADRLCEFGECPSVAAMLEAVRQVALHYRIK